MGATSRRAQKRVVAMLAVAAALVIGAAAFRRDAIVEWWYARALKSTDRAERARAVLVVKVWDDLSGAKIVETQGDDRVAVGDAVFIVPDPPKTEPGPAIGPSFPRA